MKKKKIAVLGLGVFGSSVAKTLTEYGQEVLGVDYNEDAINKAAEITTRAICGDFTSRTFLKKLNIADYDYVIVAESSNLETSLVTISGLKALGVKHVICKAKNSIQQEMLIQLGADQTIKPETEMAERLAKSILNKSLGDMIAIDEDYSLIDISILQSWANHTLRQLNLRKMYDINVVGIKHKDDHSYTMNVDPDMKLSLQDRFLILVHKDTLNKLKYLEKQ